MSAKCLAVALIVLLLAPAGWAATALLPIVTHDGRPYVELTRVAASMQSRGSPPAKIVATPASTRAQLRAGSQVVTLTRNWSQVLVNGKPVVLDAPVRVKRGVWLVPESFVGRILPTLVASAAPGPTGARFAAAPPEVNLEDVRVRSYPSFTRIVVETSSAVTHRIESSGHKEARVRLVGLGSGAHNQEIGDGLIAEVRVDRAGSDGLLRVVYEGTAGTLRASTLADPPRIVLDVARPVDPGARESREQLTPLKTIVLDAGHGGHDSGATPTISSPCATARATRTSSTPICSFRSTRTPTEKPPPTASRRTSCRRRPRTAPPVRWPRSRTASSSSSSRPDAARARWTS